MKLITFCERSGESSSFLKVTFPTRRRGAPAARAPRRSPKVELKKKIEGLKTRAKSRELCLPGDAPHAQAKINHKIWKKKPA